MEIRRPFPQVKIATNLNIISVNKSGDDLLEVPFIFTITYNPSVAQISFKGKAHVTGDREELKRILSDFTKKKPPEPVVMQTISNMVFLESVLISRTINVPPPIPLPQVPLVQDEKKKTEPTYRA